MNTKIGFVYTEEESAEESIACENVGRQSLPRKCLAEIRFPGVNKPYTYYNELFELKVGDYVFVDGKLERTMGLVVSVSYNFKIKPSDYRRVIGKADTDVSGEFNFAGSHLVTFDSRALPFEKAFTWFLPGDDTEEEYITGSDGSSFSLENLDGLDFDEKDLEKGKEIFFENAVEYIELNGTKGRAVVVTSKPYRVEFTYKNGEISDIYCECYHTRICRHCFAVLMELRSTLGIIKENYPEKFEKSDYFASILKTKFFSFAVDGKGKGSISL